MVTVRFFGPIRDAVGATSLEAGCDSLEEVVRTVSSRGGPDVARHLDRCVVWVNGAPPAPGGRLRPGDEVAFLSPVSGG